MTLMSSAVNRRWYRRMTALLLIPLLLVSCVRMYDPEGSQEQNPDVLLTLSAGERLGQTLILHRPRLERLALYLANNDKNPTGGSVLLTLYPLTGDSIDRTAAPLASASLSVAQISASGPAIFSFEPLSNKESQKVYMELQVDRGEIQVRGQSLDVYPDGQGYENGQPISGDLAWQQFYKFDLAAFLTDVVDALPRLWLLIPLLATLVLPGWLLLRLSGFHHRFDSGEQAGLSLGLSLALWPTVLVWTTQLGMKWKWFSAPLVLVSILVIFILAKNIRKTNTNTPKHSLHRFSIDIKNLVEKPVSWAGICLLLIFLFSLALRLVMVRDLAGPPWVDSVHHALLVRLIMSDGGFPTSYAPYLQSEHAAYHSGFHASAAIFQWMSGLDLIDGLQLYGQVINAAVVVIVYLLARRLGSGPLGANLAALAAGIFTPMPAYYTSWGRYSQLAGILILPASFAFLQAAVHTHQEQRSKAAPGAILLAGLALGGLALSHYRVAAFWLLLAICWMAIRWFVSTSGSRRKVILQDMLGISLVGILAFLLTLPWWPNAYSDLIQPWGMLFAQPKAQDFTPLTWAFQNSATGRPITLLAGAAFIIAFLRRQGATQAIILGMWILGMLLLANLRALGLPGAGFVNSLSVEITLFLPITILAGSLLARLINGINVVVPYKFTSLYAFTTSLALLIVTLVASPRLITILNSTTFLLRQADRPALAWIDSHTPADAVFWTNAFNWGYSLYATSDGGAWIAPVTGRASLPPPVLYGLDLNRSRMDLTSQRVREAIDLSNEPALLSQELRAMGVTHVFIGARGGPLSPAILLASPDFNNLYHTDGVWIFALQP